MKIFKAEQVKLIDNYTIENEPVSSINLMERAAWQCSVWIMKHFTRNQPIKIFCGCGNNGGDGLAIARQLASHDYTIYVYLIKIASPLSPDTDVNFKALKEITKIPFQEIETISQLPVIESDNVVIDAIFGSGLNRPLTGFSAEVVEYLNRTHAVKVAIDIPSGLIGEGIATGSVVFKADYTLTFQFPFLSFLFPENQEFVGQWEVLDIGLHKKFIDELSTPFKITSLKDIQLKQRPEFGHKGTFGHALIVAGSKGMAGAAILSSKACLRSGCGLVTVYTSAGNAPVVHTAFPEALVSYDVQNDYVSQLPEINKYNAVAIGPGLGTHKQSAKVIATLFAQKPSNLVIDADALNILGSDKQLLNSIPKGAIITPHPGEFDRLFGKSENSYNRLLLQISKSKELEIVIVLKGRYTSIALPNGDCCFNPTGNNGMATAGSGDVLTGIIVSLLAQGYKSSEAAIIGTYLHGLAGDGAAQKLGQEALIASDIIDHLHFAFLQIKKNTI